MKIAIIGDPHFGIKRNFEEMLESQKRFFKVQLFPTLYKNDIRDVIILGDIFHLRDTINIKVINEVFNIFKDEDFNFHIICGNHDLYHTNTLKITSLRLFENFKNITVYSEITERLFGYKNFLFVPWIFEEEKFIEDLNKFEADYVIGHLDINGFSMSKSQISDGKITPDVFNKFKNVISGHFHSKQTKIFNLYFNDIILEEGKVIKSRDKTKLLERQGKNVIEISTLDEIS